MDRISKLLKSVNREMKQKIQIFDEETLKFKVMIMAPPGGLYLTEVLRMKYPKFKVK